MDEQSKTRSLFKSISALSAMLTAGLQFAAAGTAGAADTQTRSDRVRAVVAGIVAEEGIPGMIAAIVDSKQVLAIGSAGLRKAHEKAALTDDDDVHLGSCTKAMTCVMLSSLVAKNVLTWDTTIAEVFPKLKNEIHPDYHNATLWQLVTHRARVPDNAQNWWAHGTKRIKDRRLAILKDNLKKAPTAQPNQFVYSNLGYMVAACMAEQRTGLTWESLMKKHVFRPLGMKSAGFGPPGATGRVNQPWGHQRKNGVWSAAQKDNAEALGPAGRVHCTVADWAKFLALQLPNHESDIVPDKLLQKLIQPVGDYAGGWIVTTRAWGNGQVLTHNGSNTLWYASVWVAPQLDRAFVVVTNSSDEKSHAICDKTIVKLISIDSEP